MPGSHGRDHGIPPPPRQAQAERRRGRGQRPPEVHQAGRHLGRRAERGQARVRAHPPPRLQERAAQPATRRRGSPRRRHPQHEAIGRPCPARGLWWSRRKVRGEPTGSPPHRSPAPTPVPASTGARGTLSDNLQSPAATTGGRNGPSSSGRWARGRSPPCRPAVLATTDTAIASPALHRAHLGRAKRGGGGGVDGVAAVVEHEPEPGICPKRKTSTLREAVGD